MKKYLLSLSLFALTLSVGGTNQNSEKESVKAKESPTQLKFETKENVGIQPFANPGDDLYEYNDTPEIATKLNVPNTTRDYNFNVTASITTYYVGSGFSRVPVKDTDYYAIPVYGRAEISLTLSNIPTGSNYDLILHQGQNRPGNWDTRMHLDVMRKSDSVGSQNEQITVEVDAGYYYIQVLGITGPDVPSQYYSLTGSVRLLNLKLENITDLRYNKGAKAAIWISDFDPAGIQPGQYYDDIAIDNTIPKSFYAPNGSLHSYPGHKINGMMSDARVMGANEIEHSVLYVWDLEMRMILFDFFSYIYQVIEAEYQTSEQARIATEAALNRITIGETIIDTVSFIAEIVGQVIVKTGGGGNFGLISTIVRFVFDIIVFVFEFFLMPDYHQEITNLLNMQIFLNGLINALDFDSAHAENHVHEVVRIPFTYKITGWLQPFFYTDYYVDFHPHIGTAQNFLYTSSTIPYTDSANIFTGKTYALREPEDIELAFDRNLAPLDYMNTSQIYELELNYPHMHQSLYNGQYHYYKFEADEDGTYEFYSLGESDVRASLHSGVALYPYTDYLIDQDDDSGELQNFKLTHSMLTGEIVYLRVYEHFTSGVDRYTPMVSKVGNQVYRDLLLTPDSFNFSGQYNNTYITTFYTDSANDITYTVDRERVGYIENYLTLSAKKVGVTEAQLGINLMNNISKVQFDMGVWSRTEGLTTPETSIRLEYYSFSTLDWETAISFEAENMNLKEYMSNYEFIFPVSIPVHNFRFIVETNAVNNNNNRGRVCLGDIRVSYLLQ